MSAATLTSEPPAAPHRRSRLAPQSPVGTALAYAAGVVVILLTIVPLFFVFLGGFRTTAQINSSPTGLPHPWVWENYKSIVTSHHFWQYMENSAIIAVTATAVVLAVGSMAAFALSRYVFRGREAVYTFFLIGLLFPVSVASLPLYLWLRKLHMLEKWWGVALPEAAFGLSIAILILRPFMRAIPAELEDAAVVDGTSKLGFFWRILLPLSRPALTTVGILSFVTSWNLYILPLLVFNNDRDYTLPLGVATFQSQYSSDTAKVFAFTALSMLPTLIFFTVAEKRIVGGLTGAVKG